MVLLFNFSGENMVIVASVNEDKALDNNKNTAMFFVDIRIVNFIVSLMMDY